MTNTHYFLRTWKQQAIEFASDDTGAAIASLLIFWPFLLVIVFYVILPLLFVTLVIDISRLAAVGITRVTTAIFGQANTATSICPE